jgi:hypothetical protein
VAGNHHLDRREGANCQISNSEGEAKNRFLAFTDCSHLRQAPYLVNEIREQGRGIVSFRD